MEMAYDAYASDPKLQKAQEYLQSIRQSIARIKAANERIEADLANESTTSSDDLELQRKDQILFVDPD